MSTLREGLSFGMKGADVARLHDLLNQTRLKPSPAEVLREQFGDTTLASLRAFQKEQELDPTGVLDEKTIAVLQEVTSGSEWAVHGAIRYSTGRPAENLIVQAFDRDFRKMQLLGKAVTDWEGRYSIHFKAGSFSRLEKAGPDISMEVRWKGAEEPLYADDASSTHYNAARVTEIDIELAMVSAAGSNEFDRLVAMMTPLIGKTPISEIGAKGETEEVVFLARELGVERVRVEHVIVAHRLNAEVGLHPAFYYALLRTDVLLGIGPDRANPVFAPIGVTTSSGHVYYDAVRLDHRVIERAVQRAVDAAWVSRGVLDILNKALSRFADDRPKANAFVKEEGARRFNDALAPFLAPGYGEVAGEFLAAAVEGDAERLVALLHAPGARPRKGRKAAGTKIQLSTILGFDDAVLERASEALGKRKGGASQLARVGRDVLREIVRPAGNERTTRHRRSLSDGARSAIDDEHVEHVVVAIEALATRRFPSAAVALRLEQDPTGIDHADEVRDFFDANPEFDLGKHNLAKFISGSNVRATKSIADSTFRGVEAAQRMYRLVEHPDKAVALLRAGYRSSGDIVKHGRTSFVKDAEASGFSVAEAERAYDTSERTHLAATLLATDLRAYDGGVEGLEVARREARAQLVPIIAEHPTLKSLFDTQDICACEECRSIYGPAAYMADVLRWLSNRLVFDTTNPGSSSTRSAKAVLFARRPDLGDIDLNCENAETPVPHIDLVCELLEEQIAPTPTVASNGTIAAGAAPAALVSAIRAASFPIGDHAIIYGPHRPDQFVVRDDVGVYALSGPGPNWTVRRLRQTHGKPAEREAAPEYVNADAYAALRLGKAAFTLPFDLFHRETRAFLAGAGLDRAELMRALQKAGVPSAGDIEGETLGFSSAEQPLVFAAAVADQPAIWGIQAATAASRMTRMDVFLDKTGLTYAEAEAMIALPYVRGGTNLFIQFDDSSCDLAKRRIRNLTDTILDRMHRLLRLSKRIGITVADLDRLARAPRLGNGNLGAAARTALVTLMRLAARLGADVPAMITWLDIIPNTGPDSLHAVLFQKAASIGPLDAVLSPEGIRQNELNETAVPDSGRKLATLNADLARAFATTAPAIATIQGRIVEIGAFGAQPPLTFVSLAAVYGRVELARALGLSAEQLVRLERLVGIDALASAARLDELVTAANLLEATGVAVEDLDYRLRRQATDLAVLDPSDASLIATLAELREALIEAAAETRSTFDPSQTVEEALAGFRAALEREPSLGVAARALFEQIIRNAPLAAPVIADAKSVVDGPLADKVDAVAVKAAIDLVAAAANAAIVNPANLEATRLGLMRALIDGLAAHNLSVQARDAAIAAILTQTGLEQSHAALFVDGLDLPIGAGRVYLGTPLSTGPIADPNTPLTPAALPDPFRALRSATLVAGLIAPFKPSADLLRFLIEDAPGLGLLDLGRLPFEGGIPPLTFAAWRDWADVIALSNAYPPRVRISGGQVGALDVFRSAGAGAAAPALLADLSLATGWPAALVTALHTHFAANVASYASPAHWRRMESSALLIAPLQVDLPQAIAFAVAAPGVAESTAARGTLRRRYRESDWLGVLKGIMDPLRELKRDALVAHLLATNPALTSTIDLYDHFLVNTQWSAKMPGSRIIQAHGTIQHFVRRCLSGYEPTATADVEGDSGWSSWDWQSMYRPWQVARQVWVEPQYYLRPEWRDDKTEGFDALVDTVMQNGIDAETSVAAVEGYLDYLDQLAFLDVLATCYDFDREQMHIFARSKGGEPEVYYHRIFERERTFTSWKKIDLDIAGDHLVAFFRNKRLYLAWPLILERGDDQQNVSVPNSAPNTPIDKSQRRFEIKLAISEYTGNRWLPRRASKEAVVSPWSTYPLNAGNLVFTVNPATRFTIDVFYLVDNNLYSGLGRFLLNGCKGYPELDTTKPGWTNFLPDFPDSLLHFQRYLENPGNPGDDLSINAVGTTGNQELFGRTPGRFRVTYPFQASEFDRLITSMLSAALGGSFSSDRQILIFGTLMPWFFEDNQRGYVIVPGLEARPEQGVSVPPFRTFTNLRRFLMDLIALIQKYILLLLAATSQSEIDAIIASIPGDDEFIRLREEFNAMQASRYRYKVRNFYHPFACKIRETFYTGGIKAMMRRDLQLTVSKFDFGSATTGYAPSGAILQPYPIEQFEFGREDAYGVHNMELFFHIWHFFGAKQIEEGLYDEAEISLRYIFDPLGSQGGTAPQKYWITKPFYEHGAADYAGQRITDLMTKLARDPKGTTELELIDRIEEWRNAPYKPYLVARGRPVAFQQAIVDLTARLYMGRADAYFRQDTLESLVQAELDYSRVERLIGKRPRVVPSAVATPDSTYNQLEAKLDAFGNALMSLENLVPDLSVLPQGGAELPPPPVTLESLYFGIPPSPKLYELWDMLELRQFRLRNSQTIDGVERTLSLTAPPLSVEALIAASASGLTLSALLAAIGAPRPPYKFEPTLRRALEVAAAAQSFGEKLLQALKDRDEAALLRLSTEQLSKLRKEQKALYFQERLAAAKQREEAEAAKAVFVDAATWARSRPYMNAWEILGVAANGAALLVQSVVAAGYMASGGLKLLPKFMIGAAGFGGSPTANAQTGGDHFGNAAEDLVKTLEALVSALSMGGAMLETQGTYQQRADQHAQDAVQADLQAVRADREIELQKIRETVALENERLHNIEIEQADAQLTFLSSKFTRTELFDWQSMRLKTAYRQVFDLALTAARQAERCLNFELGTDVALVRNDHWDTTRNGLLAAETLTVDLRRLESFYFENNVREREITRRISLSRLDPVALLGLRTTGRCRIELPEQLFDLDHPGHYCRRIRHVSLSLPCVAGPYTAVPVKLTLIDNRVRISTARNPGAGLTDAQAYAENPDDQRFQYHVGAIEGIDTSRGDEDSGLFASSLDDPRYLPFEGAGAISTWTLELPQNLRPFDYSTITDAIMIVRYRARDGGSSFRAMVANGVRTRLDAMALATSRTGLFHAIDIRRDRPDLWHLFTTTNAATIPVKQEDLPYFTQGHTPTALSTTVLARVSGAAPASLDIGGAPTPLAAAPGPELAGLLMATPSTVPFDTSMAIAKPAGSNITDLIVATNYRLAT